MRSQPRPIAPPTEKDKEKLLDFSAVVQDNASELFRLAHEHDIRTSAPDSNDGSAGDIVLVNDGSTYKLYVRFSTGWKSITLS